MNFDKRRNFMKKSTKISLIIVGILIVCLIAFEGFLLVKNKQDSDKKISELQNEVTNLKDGNYIENSNNVLENTTNEKNENKNTNTTNNSKSNETQTNTAKSTENQIKNEEGNYNKYDEDGYIILKNSEVKNSDYYKLWSNESDMTQIQINEDGTYLFDHYTASSEVKGTYKINGTNIIFTDENGTEWNGTMRREEAGNLALKISKNGEKVTLYDGEGD
jgi:hypothetical protein